MDSFTLAVVIGGGVVLAIFGAFTILDKGAPPPKESAKRKTAK